MGGWNLTLIATQTQAWNHSYEGYLIGIDSILDKNVFFTIIVNAFISAPHLLLLQPNIDQALPAVDFSPPQKFLYRSILAWSWDRYISKASQLYHSSVFDEQDVNSVRFQCLCMSPPDPGLRSRSTLSVGSAPVPMLTSSGSPVPY